MEYFITQPLNALNDVTELNITLFIRTKKDNITFIFGELAFKTLVLRYVIVDIFYLFLGIVLA